ncbi:hypothetical protein AAY473_020646 [Plecturocebus cupreus]
MTQARNQGRDGGSLSLLTRLVLNSWAQVTLLPWPHKVLELQVRILKSPPPRKAASLLVLAHAKNISAPGPLHLLFSLPGNIFLQISTWLAALLSLALCSNSISLEKTPLTILPQIAPFGNFEECILNSDAMSTWPTTKSTAWATSCNVKTSCVLAAVNITISERIKKEWNLGTGADGSKVG